MAPDPNPVWRGIVGAMDEATLLDKLRKIEALHAGATSEGERNAARAVAERIRARLIEQRSQSPDISQTYSLPDPWERMLFIALCRRYGLRPYRKPRQRANTVMVDMPVAFHELTLWPEFVALADVLAGHLRDVTERVIHEAIHDDAGDAEEFVEPRKLPGS